ncbi:MAG: hypothetical protein JWM83_2110 [Candidatus Angelobacter sp.]|nr:hypothetical protein [Candidatus Angelobacter sp.]
MRSQALAMAMRSLSQAPVFAISTLGENHEAYSSEKNHAYPVY